MPTAHSGYFIADGTKVPSVTQVISRFKDSGALIHWAWKCGRDGVTARFSLLIWPERSEEFIYVDRPPNAAEREEPPIYPALSEHSALMAHQRRLHKANRARKQLSIRHRYTSRPHRTPRRQIPRSRIPRRHLR